MASMTLRLRQVNPIGVLFGGIDTHKDIHVAALLDGTGRWIGHGSVSDHSGRLPAAAGLDATLLGSVARVGVEGTGSYGAGICRRLTAAGDGGGGGEPAGPQPAATPRQIRHLGCRRCRQKRPVAGNGISHSEVQQMVRWKSVRVLRLARSLGGQGPHQSHCRCCSS